MSIIIILCILITFSSALPAIHRYQNSMADTQNSLHIGHKIVRRSLRSANSDFHASKKVITKLNHPLSLKDDRDKRQNDASFGLDAPLQDGGQSQPNVTFSDANSTSFSADRKTASNGTGGTSGELVDDVEERVMNDRDVIDVGNESAILDEAAKAVGEPDFDAQHLYQKLLHPADGHAGLSGIRIHQKDVDVKVLNYVGESFHNSDHHPQYHHYHHPDEQHHHHPGGHHPHHPGEHVEEEPAPEPSGQAEEPASEHQHQHQEEPGEEPASEHQHHQEEPEEEPESEHQHQHQEEPESEHQHQHQEEPESEHQHQHQEEPESEHQHQHQHQEKPESEHQHQHQEEPESQHQHQEEPESEHQHQHQEEPESEHQHQHQEEPGEEPASENEKPAEEAQRPDEEPVENEGHNNHNEGGPTNAHDVLEETSHVKQNKSTSLKQDLDTNESVEEDVIHIEKEEQLMETKRKNPKASGEDAEETDNQQEGADTTGHVPATTETGDKRRRMSHVGRGMRYRAQPARASQNRLYLQNRGGKYEDLERNDEYDDLVDDQEPITDLRKRQAKTNESSEEPKESISLKYSKSHNPEFIKNLRRQNNEYRRVPGYIVSRRYRRPDKITRMRLKNAVRRNSLKYDDYPYWNSVDHPEDLDDQIN